jgi:hypothetical protein
VNPSIPYLHAVALLPAITRRLRPIECRLVSLVGVCTGRETLQAPVTEQQEDILRG